MPHKADHKTVKLNRPTSLNVEREIKQNKKLNRLKYKKKKRCY